MTGGGGADNFAFFDTVTAGNSVNDYITDFSATDTLILVGYASTATTASVSGSASVVLTLSDNTKITFTNLNSTSALNGHTTYF